MQRIVILMSDRTTGCPNTFKHSNPMMRHHFVRHLRNLGCALLAAVCGVVHAVPAISPDELLAPKVEVSGGNVNFTVQTSVLDRMVQWCNGAE